MPKTIDQRVVEMQFDNRNFEKNVSQSMSTLDKLKEKLNFRGASKAIDELNGSVKKLDFNPVASALTTVGEKFSALEQIGIGALRRIGDQAAQTGERLIKSLSIDNISAGWEKFGKKTVAVATLRAQGYEMEKIEGQLEKLNFFTDETSYNFTDMVDSIGKFTASGKDLEESVTAMEGIAAWAALSGQNATTASQAMYQLSQAMGAGVMRREDYRSIQNANMDTAEFRQRTIDAALALGTLEEVSEGVYKSVSYNPKEIEKAYFTIDSFADHLTQDMWLTSDVMMKVYKDYGKAANAIQEYMSAYDVDTASEAMEQLEEQAKALVDIGKAATMDDAFLDIIAEIPGMEEKATAFMDEYNASLEEGQTKITDWHNALIEMGYGLDEFSLKAFKAGQEARTWTDVIDSVKDAVSTGWSNTFENIFGNYEESKKLWTRLANDFWDIFAAGGDERNSALDIWRNYISSDTRNMLAATPDSATKADLTEKNTIDGRDLLFSTDEENLGAFIQMLESLKDLLAIIKDSWNEVMFGTSDADEVAAKKADILMSITKAIKSFADSLVISEEKAKNLRQVFKGLFGIIGLLGDILGGAFSEGWKLLSGIFGNISKSTEGMTLTFGDSIEEFRAWLKQNKVIEKFFSGIGDAISAVVTNIKGFLDYIASMPFIADIIGLIRDKLDKAAELAKDFFDGVKSGKKAGEIFSDLLKKLKEASSFFKFLSDMFGGIKSFFSGIGTNIRNMFSGAGSQVKSFADGVTGNFQNIGTGIGNVFSGVADQIKSFFGGIAEGFKSTGDGISSFSNGLKPIVDVISGAFVYLADQIKTALGEITAEKIVGMIAAGALFIFLFRVINTVSTIAEGIEGINSILEASSRAVDRFSKTIQKIGSAAAWDIRAHAFMTTAKALLLLAGAIVVLCYMDTDKLLLAAGIMASLMIALAAITRAGSGTGSRSNIDPEEIKSLAITVGLIAGAFLALTFVLKNVIGMTKGIDIGNLGLAALIIIGLGVILDAMVGGLAFIATRLSNSGNLDQVIENLKQFALLAISLAGAILIVGVAAKLLADAPAESIGEAMKILAVFMVALVALTVITKIGRPAAFDGMGQMLLGAAGSLLIVFAAIKLFASLDLKTFEDGYYRIGLVGLIFAALIAVSFLAGQYGKEAGSMLLKISAAFVILVGVIALISLLDPSTFWKGYLAVAAFGALAALLIAVSKRGGRYGAKAGLLVLQVSGAILILAGVMWALAYIPTDGAIKAGIIIGAIMLLFAGLIFVTKFAQDVKSTIITLTAAIVGIAGAIAALSLIGGQNGSVIAAAGAIGIVMAAFAGLLAITKIAGKATGTIILITIVTAVIGGILTAMSALDVDGSSALKNAAGISMLLTVMTGVVAALSALGNVIQSNMKGLFIGIAGLAVVSGVVWVLSGALQDMSKSSIANPEYISHATALIMLLGVMTGVVTAISLLGGLVESHKIGFGIATVGLYAIDGVLAILSAILQDMSKSSIANPEYISHAQALITLLGVMTLVVAAISLLGTLNGAMAVGVAAGVLGLYAISGVLGILNAIIQDLSKTDYNANIANAQALSNLLTAMSGVLILLGVGGMLAIPAIIGAAVMLAAIMAMFEITKSIGELVTKVPEIQEFIDTGIPLLEQLSSAFGSFFGNVVGGFIQGAGEQILELIPSLGTKLSAFATNAKPFVETMSGISAETMSGVKMLIEAVSMMTASEFVDKLVEFGKNFTLDIFGATDDGDSFSDKLKTLGEGIKSFSDNLNNGDIEFDSKKVKSAAEAIQSIVDIENSQEMLVGNDLGLLGDRLTPLGEGISSFFQSIGKAKVDKDRVNEAIAAINSLSVIEKSLADGYTNLGTFGDTLPALGTGIATFGKTITEAKINIVLANQAIQIIKELVAIDTSLDDENGFIQWITGQNDLALFGDRLTKLANGLVNFCTALNVEGYDETAADRAIGMIERLALIENSLDNDKGHGGWDFLNIFSDENNLKNFADRLPYLARGLVAFSGILTAEESAFNSGTSATVENAIDTLGKFSGIQNAIGAITTICGLDTSSFSTNLPPLADGLNAFADKMNGVEDPTGVQTAIDMLTKLGEMNAIVEQAADPGKLDTLTTSLNSYQTAITNLGDAIAAIGSETDKYDPGKITTLSERIDEISALADKAGTIDYSKFKMGNVGTGSTFSIPGLTDLTGMTGEDVSSSLLGGFSGSGGDSITNAVSGMFDGSNGFDIGSFFSKDGEGGQAFGGAGENAIGSFISGFMGGDNGSEGGTNAVQDAISGMFDGSGGFDIGSFFSKDGEGGQAFGGAGENAIGSFISGFMGGDNGSEGGANAVQDAISGMFDGGGGGFDIGSFFSKDGDGGKTFGDAGGNAIASLVGSLGSENNEQSVEEAGKDTADSFITGFAGRYENISNAGTFAVQGLVSAVKDMAPEAQEAGEEIARSLASGIELTLEIRSPSRVTYELGKFAGLGFINALNDQAAASGQAGGEIGRSATDGIREALERSASAFDTSVNVEPTIRPVLDLSNVNSGIGLLGGMFDTSYSVGLAGSAKTLMSEKSMNVQNEIKTDNSDVVAELGYLRQDINAMTERITNMQIYLDKNVLVGEISEPMNKALGSSFRHSRRER